MTITLRQQSALALGGRPDPVPGHNPKSGGMKQMRSNTVAALLGIVAVASPMSTMAEDRPMGFFVT
ncbi:MAG: hypothetical protein KDI25_12460, partial [Pseudomonadales bacterium]|nr:hypothetical protein [Pseudomonadales bacterium]